MNLLRDERANDTRKMRDDAIVAPRESNNAVADVAVADVAVADVAVADVAVADVAVADASSASVSDFDSRRVFGNILSLGGGEIASRAIAFVATAYLARVLGPAGFGIIGFAAAISGYLSLVVSTGFNAVGAREVARRPQDAVSLAGGVILVRLMLALCAALVMMGVAWFIDKPLNVRLVVALMSLSFFSLALDTAWVYKGLERNHRVAWALMIGQVVFVLSALSSVKTPHDVARVPIAQFTGDMVAAMFLAVPLLRGKVGSARVKLHLRAGLGILRSSGFLAASKLMRMLIYTFDIVLIGFWLGEKQAGLYSAAYRICFLLLAVGATIQGSYLPAATRAATQSAQNVAVVARRALELTWAVAAPCVVGGIVLAAPLLRTIFGARYEAGAPAFRILLFSVGCIFAHGILHNILLAGNRLKIEMGITSLATVLNVALNLFFIRTCGLPSAALATVLAEATILVGSWLVVRQMGVRLDLRFVARPLLAALIMGVVLSVFRSNMLLISCLVLGAVIYSVALVILKGVPDDAREHLQGLVTMSRRWKPKVF